METVYLARQSDGLLLCETWFSKAPPPGTQNQVYKLLKMIGQDPPVQDRCTLDSQDRVFHYRILNGVVFMAACDKGFNKKLAFLFLEDIALAFQEELKLEFGTHSTDYRSVIETMEKPFAFLRFDRVVQRKIGEYRDTRSAKSIQKLNESVEEVSVIMRRNVQDILQRGEDLQSVSKKADDLKASSIKFKRMTKVLSFRAMLQKYAAMGFIIAVIVLVVLWKVVF